MTAEVVLMNREAVAMAADSAVTLSDSGREKVFPSANKVFSLSKYHPVGIMVFGNAHFMGVPWEAIVKEFRQVLGDRCFESLPEYAEALFEYLKSDRRYSPATRQHHLAQMSIGAYFWAIRDQIESEWQSYLEDHGDMSEEYAQEVFEKHIEMSYEVWKRFSVGDGMPHDYRDRLLSLYKPMIVKTKKDVFPKRLSSTMSRFLTELAVFLLACAPTDEDYIGATGVVVAGFGSRDIFPRLQAFAVGGVVGDIVQVRKTRESIVDQDNAAFLAAFAQKEMVVSFMEGVDPKYDKVIQDTLSSVVVQLPRLMLDAIDEVGEEDKARYRRRFRDISRNLIREFGSRVNDYRHSVHVRPVITAISALPKDELAAVAEAMVNLTAFKRRVSMDSETVGGPIDVAVISKGDGLIWIKRKHYFNIERNQHFLANYFRKTDYGQKEDGQSKQV